MIASRPLPARRVRAHRSTGLAWLVGLALLVLTGVSGPGAAAEAPTEDLSAYAGRWRRVDDGETEAARLLAIDEAISGLNWLMRKMASGVLRSTTTPPPELEFVWDGERLHQRVQGADGPETRPVLLGAEPRSSEDHRGVPFTWAWTQTPAGLRVRWEQHQAHGSNVYHVDEDTDRARLIVRHTINVTALSDVEPIVYVSRFERAETAIRASGPAKSSSSAD